tara:strand:- start:610 stop:1074 length:465 start_codon:yes stop_codon:yes gene_type:complete
MDVLYLGPDKNSLIWNINNLNKSICIKNDKEKKERLLDYYNLDERQRYLDIIDYYNFLDNSIDNLNTCQLININDSNSNTNKYQNHEISYNLNNNEFYDSDNYYNYVGDNYTLLDDDTNYLTDDINFLEKYIEETYNIQEFEEYYDYYQDNEIY